MRLSLSFVLSLLLATSPSLAAVQCGLGFNNTAPKVAEGWEAYTIANNLQFPRHLVFDKSGNLLIADRGDGIVALKLRLMNGCVEVERKTTIIEQTDLNHGIALSPDGKTLFASSSTKVFAWEYDAEQTAVRGRRVTVVEGMQSTGLLTRTLLVPEKKPDTLLVQMGALGNMDYECRKPTGCNIRSFNIKELPEEPYDYNGDGDLFAWGLRNSVGVAESGDGAIWSVENGPDDVKRDNQEIHEDNPAEELNYHGTLFTSAMQGKNYGYPECFATWDTRIPGAKVEVADQFTPSPNATFTDATCQQKFEKPALALEAHTAPLDIKFYRPDFTGGSCESNAGSGGLDCEYVDDAFVANHGAFNQEAKSGYSVVTIPFQNFKPEAAQNSDRAAKELLWPADIKECPGKCFRPTGIAFDSNGRMFVTSDTTKELIVLTQTASKKSAAPSTRIPSSWALAGVLALVPAFMMAF